MQRLIIAILAATLGAVAVAASAQPLDGAGPLAMLGKIGPQLNLNTSQQQQWDALMAQAKAAREVARANFAALTAALRAELAKPEPDLAAVAVRSDSLRQDNAALRKQTRDAWLALYATFTPEQKAVTRDAILAGLDRVEAWRSRRHGPPPAD